MTNGLYHNENVDQSDEGHGSDFPVVFGLVHQVDRFNRPDEPRPSTATGQNQQRNVNSGQVCHLIEVVDDVQDGVNRIISFAENDAERTNTVVPRPAADQRVDTGRQLRQDCSGAECATDGRTPFRSYRHRPIEIDATEVHPGDQRSHWPRKIPRRLQSDDQVSLEFVAESRLRWQWQLYRRFFCSLFMIQVVWFIIRWNCFKKGTSNTSCLVTMTDMTYSSND